MHASVDFFGKLPAPLSLFGRDNIVLVVMLVVVLVVGVVDHDVRNRGRRCLGLHTKIMEESTEKPRI